ncbi:hypothetical protein HGRIS_006843 [Hohenbuehelia grisea]|uniref:Uncharacterized protein n=1 Tax=Hohenbuehelia grisea TaxID=104357 RepID=A0ABR3JAT5_9AGAR
MSAGAAPDKVSIDDRDPNIIYTGEWILGGGPGEYKETTLGATSRGSTLRYSFRGTSIAVVGTISPAGFRNRVPPITTYILDGGPAVTYRAHAEPTTQHQRTFYTSPTLQDGEHTLVVTCTNDNTYYWFDYLLVMPSIPGAAASASASSSVSSSASARSSAGAGPRPSPSPSPSVIIGANPDVSSGLSSSASLSITSQPPSASSSVSLDIPAQSSSSSSSSPSTAALTSSSSEFPTGTVVGSIIGAMAAITMVLLILLLKWRRQRAAAAIGDTRAKPFTSPLPSISNVENGMASAAFSSSHFRTDSQTSSMPVVSPKAARAPWSVSPTSKSHFSSSPPNFGGSSGPSITADGSSVLNATTTPVLDASPVVTPSHDDDLPPAYVQHPSPLPRNTMDSLVPLRPNRPETFN